MKRISIAIAIAASLSGCANANKPVNENTLAQIDSVVQGAIVADNATIAYMQSKPGSAGNVAHAQFILLELTSMHNQLIAEENNPKVTNLQAIESAASAAVLDYTAFVTSQGKPNG